MDDFETWLQPVYQAGGDRDTLDRLYDEWAADCDRQLRASGNPYLAIPLVSSAGSWRISMPISWTPAATPATWSKASRRWLTATWTD